MALHQSANDLNLSGLKITRPDLSQEDEKLRLYLLQNANAFAVVDELRERGWSSPEGDVVYQKKYQRADERIKNKNQERPYFDLYRKIARELQVATGAFTVGDSSSAKVPFTAKHSSTDTEKESSDLRGLNLCMAPGGYTKVLLEHNPKMFIDGITLPEGKGGHPVMDSVAEDSRVEVEYQDMNLLASAMGVAASAIPTNHPDAAEFLTNTPFAKRKYDVVIADGAVLRVHERGEHRLEKEREALRLRLSQLIFGLERIKTGGTLIFLSHRIDSWDNFALLRNFEQFSKVNVYKPKQFHGQSSSYYLIAKNVQRDHPMVGAVLEKWKANWRQATFAGIDGKGTTPEGPSLNLMMEAIKGYGSRFVELGSPVWKTQADALRGASYMKPRRSGGFMTASPSNAGSINTMQPRTPVRENPAGSWLDRGRSRNVDENTKPSTLLKNIPRPGKGASAETAAKAEKPAAAHTASWW